MHLTDNKVIFKMKNKTAVTKPQTASQYLKERSYISTPKDSLLDEIEARLDHNWKVGLMIGDKDS